MVIIPRKTIEVDLSLSGFTPEQALVVHRERGFIDRGLFERWASDVLFPEIQRRRAYESYIGTAVLILDGCTCHDSDWFLDEALVQQVVLHWMPPH
jgi:hypothetical protein